MDLFLGLLSYFPSYNVNLDIVCTVLQQTKLHLIQFEKGVKEI
jgi:hypothetical protein